MNDDSLIRREQEQGALFPSDLEEAGFLPLERDGVYSGERLFTQEPLKYRQIVVMSARGIGQLQIAKVLKVSHSTVRAVQRREGDSIDIVKQALSQVMMDGAQLAAEEFYRRLQECPSAVQTKDLVIAMGILTDKGLLTAGEATARLEISQVNVGEKEFAAYLAAMTGGVAAEVPTKRAGGSGSPGDGPAPGGPGAGTIIDVTEERPPGTGDSQSPDSGT